MLQILELRENGVLIEENSKKEFKYFFQLFQLAQHCSISGLSLKDNSYIILNKRQFMIKKGYKTIFLACAKMTNGLDAYVIEDKGSLSIIVQFEDGYITNATRASFFNGNIANKNISMYTYRSTITNDSKSLLGKTNKMNCGLSCTIIKDNGYSDITVQFEDGEIVEHTRRDHFFKGSILAPSYKDTSILGQRSKMNCGEYCTVIEDIGSQAITVQFDDGTIVHNRSRRAFRHGNIAKIKHSMQSQKTSILGQRAIMTNGLWCEVIKYNTCRDITVKFDIDGFVKQTTKEAFQTRNIGHPLYTTHSKTTILGKTIKMNCGLSATCIKDDRCDDITVQFEDGTLVEHRHRSEFLNRTICHPTFRPKEYNSILGKVNRMRNGLNAKVIRDNGCYDIDIEFEDGFKVLGVSRHRFLSGFIRHPDYTLSSFPELILYRYVKSEFSDAVHNYRPDWLKNKKTGRNLELDIWIPSLMIGIEYDGFTYHSSLTDLISLKHSLIEESSEISQLITIAEPGTVLFEGNKFINLVALMDNNSSSYIEYGLLPVIQKLLQILGSSKIVSKNDKELIRDVTTRGISKI